MLGTVLGHYRIEAKLGEGGMGVVYRARDEHLQRDVAIKVLSAGTLADQAARDRFRTEALSLSRLSHPNIETVYDFDTEEGCDFLVLEYLPGQPLSRSLAAGPLPEADIVRLGCQVVEALVAAHAAGVIHRDLKPGNLMVLPDGHVKILDFGLAKLRAPVSEAPGASTTTGIVAGTLPYMAPEQLRGERVDGRTDLYALGVVFYEMTTGQAPYRETTSLRLADAILHAECPPPLRLRPGLSPCLEGLILKCLAKDPTRRYQSAAEVLADLQRSATAPSAGRVAAAGRRTRAAVVSGAAALLLVIAGLVLNVGGLRDRWFGAGPSVARDSIAVLPLKNLSGDPEQDYFGAGVTEDIISHLAKLPNLKVISRTSVEQYKNTTKSLKTIADELDVDTVLEGSVRRAAGRVRIAVQLIDARTDAHLWAETYDRELADIFAVQSDVARQVAAKLEASLASQGPTLVEEKPTSSPEAYDRYLRGNLYPSQGLDERSTRAGILLYEDAVNIDPAFALAWARLAEGHASMWWLHYDRSAERQRLAKAALDRAVALQPQLPEVHRALGYYHFFVHLDYDRALAEFEIARKGRPGASWVVMGMGLVKRRQGRFEDALTDQLVSVELDPRSPTVTALLCDTYARLRKPTQAVDCLDRSLALNPARGEAFYGKAHLHLRLTGDVASARAMLQRAERAGLAGEVGVAYGWVSLEMATRDYEAALRRLSASPGEAFSDQAWFMPKALLEAQIRALLQDSLLSRRAYRAARAFLEQKLREDPEDSRYHSALGLALAGFGLKDEAIRAGKRATELLPVSKEALRGPYRIEDLAHIYAMVGDADAAIDQLEYLMSIPGDLGAGALRLDPAWDPLRSHPRFQRLLERAAK